MTSTQIAEWEAYSELEPFGVELNDNRVGMIIATIANLFVTAFGLSAKSGKKLEYRTEDFVPDRLKEPVKEEPVDAKMKLAEEIKSALLEINK